MPHREDLGFRRCSLHLGLVVCFIRIAICATDIALYKPRYWSIYVLVFVTLTRHDLGFFRLFFFFTPPSHDDYWMLAYVPSSLGMICTMLAFATYLDRTQRSSRRPLDIPIGWVGLGALIGWPFSALASLPMVFEEVFARSFVSKSPADSRRLIFEKLIQVVYSCLKWTLLLAVSGFMNFNIL